MTTEHSVYFSSYRSALTPDELLYTYVMLRQLYDPIPLNVDLPTFKICVRNLGIVQSYIKSMEEEEKPTGYLKGHIYTLAHVINNHVLRVSSEQLEPEKPVAYTPGSEDWLLELEASTKKDITHAIKGEEGNLTANDFFKGALKPTSPSARKEILHQFLTCENLKQRMQGPDGKDQLEYIFLAKDIMYMTLINRYLDILRSRASKYDTV